MWIRRTLLVLAVFVLGPVSIAQAITLPTNFSQSAIITVDSLTRPTNFAITPDGRVFITLQGDAAHGGGAVLVYDDDSQTLLGTPAIVVPTNYQNEHGLLGITFDPEFEDNGYMYLYYTTVAAPVTNSVHRISRFTVTGNTASLASEVVLLETGPIGTAEWHHGGEMQFGQDGMLYIGFGDNLNRPRPGSTATSIPHNAQELDTLFGKIARIDPRDGDDADNLPDQLIPEENPFVDDVNGSLEAIYATGMRHPYKIDTRPTDGKMLFIDVGNSTAEEINELASGANYGWPQTEGDFTQTTWPDFTRPVYAYAHGSGGNNGCAITAGAFYNPPVQMFPSSYVGKFFFAEYCNAWMKTYDTGEDTATSFATATEDNVIGIEFSPVDGSMLYLVRNRPGGPGVPSDNDTGHIYRVIYTGLEPPDITVHPQNRTASLTQTATFSCSAYGNPAPTYKWQRQPSGGGGFTDIAPPATGDSYTTPALTATDNGSQYQCVATNTQGSDTSNAGTLTVLDNAPPIPVITSPKATMLYSGGQKIVFQGKATDAEDGKLPASAFTWSVAFQHNTHVHPFMAATPGVTKGNFITANTAHGSTEVWYRVYLTVVDSDGATGTAFVDVLPRVATMTVQTSPPGLSFGVDTGTYTTPYVLPEIAGIQHGLSAPLTQMFSGSLYALDRWSDRKPADHDIAAPKKNTTYTALYSLIDVKNGSFEAANNAGRPSQWGLSGLASGDGQVCDQFFTDLCSLTLFGGAKAKSLKQALSFDGLAGDDLTLNFASHTVGASGFTLRVILTQNDNGTQTQDFALTGDTAWAARVLNIVALEPYKKLEVRILGDAGSAGQVWLDSLHLVKNN